MKELYDECIVRGSWSPFIMENVQEIARELVLQEKYASSLSGLKFGERWMRRWKEIYGIKYKKKSGNKKIVPAADIEKSKAETKTAMEGFYHNTYSTK